MFRDRNTKFTGVMFSFTKEKSSNIFFSNYFMNITVPFHSVLHYIFILRFDYFAWNCEIGTLLNFRVNMIYASPFRLSFVKNFTGVAIHFHKDTVRSLKFALNFDFS
jgi:ABC-type uncharacterized transport system permease subunit